MDRRHFGLAAAAAAIGAGGLYFGTRSGGGDPIGVAFAQDAASAADIDTSGIAEMSTGNPDAAVTVIEYASYTCPHCARFHAGPYKQLKTDFIDTGKIKFVNREVFFDRYGVWAAILARCGNGGAQRYFGIADMLYERQRQWAGRGNSAEQIVAQLRTIGRTAGLTDAEMDSCFSDADFARALVANYEKNAAADYINATPSFVINGRKYSNMAYDQLRATVESKLPS